MHIIWVATDGDDYSGDGSYTTPYKTIEYAISVFTSGDQIRLKDGEYNPNDSLRFLGVEGSVFADTPLGVTIQPRATLSSNAVLEIVGSSRFSVHGVAIKQAISTDTNQIGIQALGVENLIVHTCSVSDFEATSGGISTIGIAVSGTGRIENCSVYNLACLGLDLYGVSLTGDVHFVDCHVYELSGGGMCQVHPVFVCKP